MVLVLMVSGVSSRIMAIIIIAKVVRISCMGESLPTALFSFCFISIRILKKKQDRKFRGFSLPEFALLYLLYVLHKTP